MMLYKSLFFSTLNKLKQKNKPLMHLIKLHRGLIWGNVIHLSV